MKYFFTTLAINEPYLTRSIDFHKNLSEKTENAFFNITTTKKDLEEYDELNDVKICDILHKYPKMNITTIEELSKITNFPLENERQTIFKFHLNLKCFSIKACLNSDKEFDFLIFTDGDWFMNDGFEESKIEKALSLMSQNDFDFVFERPHKVGPAKIGDNCFFPDKVTDYYLLEHDKWDEAHVPNEQILLFKNNVKLRLFAMRWEQFMWYSVANDLMCYPDGFEIGVSALESNMKINYFGILSQLSGCFYFYTKWGTDKNIRF